MVTSGRATRLLPGALEVRAPSPRDTARFLAAARRSRAFHRRWGDPPRTAGAFRAYLERQGGASHRGHLLIERASGELVGVVNVMEIIRGSFQGAFLGYYLFLGYEGRGYMTQGLTRVIDRAFGPLRLHRLEANIQPDNVRSIRLVQRLGFRYEGMSPRYLKVGGRWRDHQRWALLREEWR
jgi:ribosomal-protein-alanine N-acetyltransferase